MDSHLVEILARVRAEVRGLDDAGGHGDTLGLEADWGGGGAGGGAGGVVGAVSRLQPPQHLDSCLDPRRLLDHHTLLQVF